jgi:hypothetical protein
MIRSVILGLVILIVIVLLGILLEYMNILYMGTVWGIGVGMFLFIGNGILAWYRFDYKNDK